MSRRKHANCSVCGQPISTLVGAFMSNVPVVCRRCFGHQTYNVPRERSGTGSAQTPDSAENSA